MNKNAATSLADFLSRRECHVTTLKADGAHLSDQSGAKILGALATNVSIRAVHLRQNSLKVRSFDQTYWYPRVATHSNPSHTRQHASMKVLGECLGQNNQLQELCLAWNNIFGEGLLDLSRGITSNRGMAQMTDIFHLPHHGCTLPADSRAEAR